MFIITRLYRYWVGFDFGYEPILSFVLKCDLSLVLSANDTPAVSLGNRFCTCSLGSECALFFQTKEEAEIVAGPSIGVGPFS